MNPIVPGVVRFEMLWSQSGVPAANVMHVAYTGSAPSSDDCKNLAGQCANAFWVETFWNSYPTSTELVGSRMTDLATDTGAVGEFPIGQSGTYEGSELTAQACMLVNLGIARRYRGGHPRIYFPPAAQPYLSGPATWEAGQVGNMVTQMNAMIAEMFSATSDGTDLAGPVCVSYRTAKAWRVDNLVEPVTGFVVSPIVATQRRRLRASSY